MRIQPYILYIIGIFLSLQSCNKHSHPNTPEEPEEETLYAISMTAASVTDMSASRALVTDETALQNTDLGVFAYKQLADGTKIRVFDNDKIYHDGSNWTYDNTRYWDRAATYYFASYSPYNDKVEYNENTNLLTIKEIPNWQPLSNDVTDYVVASDEGAANGYYITPNGAQPVPLDFKHILAQLEVRVVKNAFLAKDYTLSGVSYANVPTADDKATYHYTHSNGYDEAGAPTAVQSTMSVTTTPLPISMATPNNAPIGNTPTEATTVKHLVAPFTSESGNFTITLNYAINGEAKSATVDTGYYQLAESNRYVITLTFNSGADIEASVKIEPWTPIDTDEDEKYNW